MSSKSPFAPVPGPRRLLAAGGACVLLAGPAPAIELGDIAVESALGQPLRASIAFALGPNEQLSDNCVYLNAGTGAAAGLPQITRASATLQGNRIVLRGDAPLREPMMSLSLSVDCPYTARLRRDFMLLLNPPSLVEEAPATLAPVAAQTEPAAARRPVNVFEPAPRPARATPRTDTAPISAGARYRVRSGDTLSGIVSRIEDRQLTLWPAVDAIFNANPQAFVNGNVDRLIAGATLTIPASLGSGVTAGDSAPAAAAADTDVLTPARAYGGVREAARDTAPAPASGAPTAAEVAAPAESEAPAPLEAAAPTAAAAAVETPAAATERQPAVDADVAPAAAAESRPAMSVGIPQTRIVQAQPEPIPLADADEANPAQSWLVWLGGSGIAIFLALLLFGRRLRELFGAAPSAEIGDDMAETQINAATHNRRSSDRGEPAADPDIDLGVPTTADPLDTGDDMDVALDYSFESSGEYRDELDFVVGESDGDDAGERTPPTRIMPPREAQLDEATGNYDMSMVLDVTKEDFGGDRKPRDLQAIEVEPLDSLPRKSPALDLTTEFDYAILEQDYEEELTATQALNREIEEAARELQKNLGEIDEADDPSQVSMAEDLDGTAEVRADVMTGNELVSNEAVSDLDDTDVSESVTLQMPESADAEPVEGESITLKIPEGSAAASEFVLAADEEKDAAQSATVQMPESGDTVEMLDTDQTVEQPAEVRSKRRKKAG